MNTKNNEIINVLFIDLIYLIYIFVILDFTILDLMYTLCIYDFTLFDTALHYVYFNIPCFALVNISLQSQDNNLHDDTLVIPYVTFDDFIDNMLIDY